MLLSLTAGLDLTAFADTQEALTYNERIIFITHDHDFTGAVAVSNNNGTHTYNLYSGRLRRFRQLSKHGALYI